MQVVSPKRPLVRRQRNMYVISGLVFSAGIFLLLVGLALTRLPWAASTSSSYSTYLFARGSVFFLGGILVLVSLGFLLRAMTLRTQNNEAVQTARELARYLDDRYTFFTNINRRDLGYIDGVLVGPPGALVFRIMDTKGSVFNEAAGWLKGGRPMNPNATTQAVHDIKSLREYLASHQLERIPVFGIIVFIYPDPVLRLQVKDPVVPPTHLTSLYTRLQADYFAKERIDTQTVNAMNKLLQIR